MNGIVCLVGDTVKIKSTFYTFDDAPTLPVEPAIKIYNSYWQLTDTIPLGEEHLVDGYNYEYDYTPSKMGTTYIESYGLVEGTPSLNRITLYVENIN